MKDVMKAFATGAAWTAGVVIGLVAGEKVSQKFFKKKPAENKTEEKPKEA